MKALKKKSLDIGELEQGLLRGDRIALHKLSHWLKVSMLPTSKSRRLN